MRSLRAGWSKMKTDNNKKKKWKFRGELLFLLPSIIGVAVFYFIPFCDVVLRSFRTEFRIISLLWKIRRLALQ